MSVGLAIQRQALRRPHELALFDHARQRTWRQLDYQTNQLANVLRTRYGVRPGDRVALLSPNRIEVAEVLGATHKAGGVYVGLNFRMSDNDLDAALDNAEPRLLIGAGELAEEGRALAQRHGIEWLDLDDTSEAGYEGLVASVPADVPPTLYERFGSDDACIVYTRVSQPEPA